MASRRNPNRAGSTRPFNITITFNGGTGMFEYYDSTKGEKVEIEELQFTPLVTKSVISGFNKNVNQQMRSNYVEDITKEPFSVFYFKEKKFTKLDGMQGLWSDIKPAVLEVDGKFSTAIIGLVVLDGVEVMAELIVARFALGQWIDINNENPDVMSSKLVFRKGPLYKKGAKTGDPAVEISAKEEKEIFDKIKKNPMAKKPVIFYGLVADITPLTDKELEFTDGKITILEDYFDALEAAAKPRSNDAPARSGKTEAARAAEEEADDDDDLPF